MKDDNSVSVQCEEGGEVEELSSRTGSFRRSRSSNLVQDGLTGASKVEVTWFKLDRSRTTASVSLMWVGPISLMRSNTVRKETRSLFMQHQLHLPSL